ncbi:MAG: hypothetical protein AB7F99_07925 [Vicinamibacterales bacterium]
MQTLTQIDTLAAALRAAQHPSGGWSYVAGQPGRIEPTCWALLAAGPQAKGQAVPHLQFLQRSQQPSGLLVEDPAQPVNAAFNGLAAFTLLQPFWADASVWTGAARRVTAALVLEKGVQLDQAPEYRQDNSLQGWSWVAGTFSWVEPTAWGLLALKTAGNGTPLDAEARARIDEGDRLLLDRACDGGGWNYGNAEVFDQDLQPYVPTTALALLALQDRRGTPIVDQGWAWLRAHAHEEPSGMALSLAIICARVYGEPIPDLETLLTAQWERSGFLGNVLVMAMALCALTPGGGAEAFRL